MSRPTAIWFLFWVVLAALCTTVWQVLKKPDEEGAAPKAQAEQSGINRKQLPEEAIADINQPSPERLKSNGLLQSLPAPQSPPERLDAKSKRQWLDDLMGLIDDASYLDDEASLRMLIVEFRNPDAAIAKSAYTSLMSRHDKAALPYLKEMKGLDNASKRSQQVEELIDFLNQPSIFDRSGSGGR